MTDHRPDLPPAEPPPRGEHSHGVFYDEVADVPEDHWAKLAPHRHGCDDSGAMCCPFHRDHPIHRGAASMAEARASLPPADEVHDHEPDVGRGGDPSMCKRPTADRPGEMCARQPGDPVHGERLGCEMCSWTDGGCSFCSGRSAIEVANERTTVAGVPVVDLVDVLEHQRRMVDDGHEDDHVVDDQRDEAGADT